MDRYLFGGTGIFFFATECVLSWDWEFAGGLQKERGGLYCLGLYSLETFRQTGCWLYATTFRRFLHSPGVVEEPSGTRRGLVCLVLAGES